jgi:dihydrofolate reductase
MAKIVAVENISLDGVMQSPGRPDEDTRGGFDRGGWASQLLAADPEAAMAAMSGQGRTAAMLFGHRTYLDLVGHWLGTDEPNPFTEILRATPKYVASRSASTLLEHPNSELLTPDADGDAVASVRALKATLEGDVVVLGSGELVRSLAAAGLVDEYLLTILPVVLGRGARLFDGYAPLEVRSSWTSTTGIVVGTYAVAAA